MTRKCINLEEERGPKSGLRAYMKTDRIAEVEFYGVVGQSFDDDFVTVPSFLRGLKLLGELDKLVILMNSPGGNAFDGFQIANRLDKLREEGTIKSIETHAEGLVGSAATLVFLKGDRRVMRNGSRFMIHKPSSFGIGNADDMRGIAERLDSTEEQAIDLYESVSALTRKEIAEAMAAVTFYSPKEAEAAGFATEVIEPFAIAACMSSNLRDTIKNIPDDLKVEDWGYNDPEPPKLGEQWDELAERFGFKTSAEMVEEASAGS